MIRDRREPLKLKRNDLTKNLTLPKEGMDVRLENERMVAPASGLETLEKGRASTTIGSGKKRK